MPGILLRQRLVHQIVEATEGLNKRSDLPLNIFFFLILLTLLKQFMCLLLWLNRITATCAHSYECYNKTNYIITKLHNKNFKRYTTANITRSQLICNEIVGKVPLELFP